MGCDCVELSFEILIPWSHATDTMRTMPKCRTIAIAILAIVCAWSCICQWYNSDGGTTDIDSAERADSLRREYDRAIVEADVKQAVVDSLQHVIDSITAAYKPDSIVIHEAMVKMRYAPLQRVIDSLSAE